jgi:hypothetical protein
MIENLSGKALSMSCWRLLGNSSFHAGVDAIFQILVPFVLFHQRSVRFPEAISHISEH